VLVRSAPNRRFGAATATWPVTGEIETDWACLAAERASIIALSLRALRITEHRLAAHHTDVLFRAMELLQSEV
jgi:hypothetical protein